MSVTAAQGFVAGGLASGIKPSGAPDLAIVATADRGPVNAAGVFTTNLVAAAPVQISRQHLHDGRAAAVVLNSGNANAATGDPGRTDALRMAELTADGLGCARRDVLVCSTGLIGIPMPMEPVEAGIPKLVGALRADVDGGTAAADAILTTDTVRKETVQHVELARGVTATIGGMAKGAAMLSPAMATMLAVLTTDAAVDPVALRATLERGRRRLVQQPHRRRLHQHQRHRARARQRALGNEPIDAHRAPLRGLRRRARGGVRRPRDADGGRRRGRDEARHRRRTRRALGGGGAHGGARRRRAASSCSARCTEAIRTGAACCPSWAPAARASTRSASTSPTRVWSSAATVSPRRTTRPRWPRSMAQRDIAIDCDLHAGTGTATVTFTDLSHAYVDENMGTS